MSFGVTTYEDLSAGEYSKSVGLIQATNLSLNQKFEVAGEFDTLGVNSFRYDNLSQAVDTIDRKSREQFLDPILAAKNNILTFGGYTEASSNIQYYGSGSAAISALESLYGAPADNDGVISTRQIITSVNWTGIGNTSGINVSAGVACSSLSGGTGTALFNVSASIGQAARIDLQDTSGSFGIGIGDTFFINGSPVSPPTSLEFAASGEVYADNVIVLFYPSLHPPNPAEQSPIANPQFKILNSTTSGTGSGQTYYRNSIQGTYDSFPYTDDSFTLLGDVYTVSTNNAAIGASCAVIDALRGSSSTTGIQSFVGAGATIKGMRYGFAVNQWVLAKTNVNSQATINANDAAIGILKNPAFQS